MKRQVAIALAISSGASYILCDEIFDGLDVMGLSMAGEFYYHVR